jgi:secreted trypsin-like serine protease
MSITEASPNQFPFLVDIDLVMFRTAGILISPEWVLTDASTLSLINSTYNPVAKLLFGSHYREQAQQHLKSYEFILHEDWNPTTFANNLALIHLPTPVALTAEIQPINCLNWAENLTGQEVESIGWGGYEDNGVRSTFTPQVVNASIVDIQVAIDAYSQQYDPLSLIAVDIKGVTTSTPVLISNGPNGRELVGLRNFGANSIGSGPEVYSRIAYFVDWINQHSGVRVGW